MSRNNEHPFEVREQLDRLVGAALGQAWRQGQRGRLAEESILSLLHLHADGASTGQLRLVRTALREMRAAYRMFNQWTQIRKVSVFGSARTPQDHPDYAAARTFGIGMTEHHWMTITGAAGGIMQAGHEGSRREKAFGLAIRLPFEVSANEVIKDDEKLVVFRYFFTRKLMFLAHADAVAVFPGGFGTMDELFEALTLVQTGRASPIPVVLVEGAGPDGAPRGFWEQWERFVRGTILADGFISAHDVDVCERAHSPQDAVERITRFYRRYHSSRFVGDTFVMRLKSPLSPGTVAALAEEFAGLTTDGKFELRGAFPEEEEHGELPRLAFRSSRRDFGLLRRLIARINEAPDA